MCEHLDQNVLCIMLLFLPFLPHVRSHLKYEHHPEITQVILGHPECAGLELEGQMAYFIPWAGQGSASDISVYR